MKKIIVLLFSLFLVQQAEAYPVDGWYWNPNESGRGLNIELQDDIMFISFFHYDAAGNPIWWVASGRYNATSRRVQGEFYRTRDGQCPSCPPRTPVVDFGFDGAFTLQFDSRVAATLYWAGGQTQLIRQYWGFDLSDPLTFMYGDYHFTTGQSGVYFGDRLRFDEEYIGTDGDRYLSGNVINGSANRIALVNYELDSGWFILVDSSTSFYNAYLFDMSKDTLQGRSWTYRKGESPVGTGLQFIAHRTASKASAMTGVGPRIMSQNDGDAAWEEMSALSDEIRYELSQASASVKMTSQENLVKETEMLETLAQMQIALEALKSEDEIVQ